MCRILSGSSVKSSRPQTENVCQYEVPRLETPPTPPSPPPPCTKMTSMITIFDHALAHGYEPRRQRSTLAKAEGVRELEEKRKNEDKVVLMLTQGEKKKKNRRSNKATSATGSLFPPHSSRLMSSKLCGLPSFFSSFFHSCP